jgi:FkbM family methyltransferase
MKISWLSNAMFAKTGYGNQSALFIPRIQGLGYDIAEICFYGLEGSILSVPGPRGPIPLYPKGFHPYGNDIWSVHSAHFGADVCISLIDAWVLAPEQNPHNIKWIPWFPVDAEPLPPPVAEKVAKAYRRIVFSKFGERMVHDAGMDCYYVPHGVDTNLMKPGSMTEARKALGFPQDAFIVGMVAANKGNPSRKAFAPQIEAFAQFKRKHSDAILYLHTSKSEHGEFQGVNIPQLCNYHGLTVERDVIFPNQYQYLLGYPDQHMAMLYNAFDVHMLVSMGEGFGIPTLEAQSCGCPVITSGWTASEELCFSGWKVSKREAQPTWIPLGSYQYDPYPGAVLDRLEAAYEMRGNQDYRKRARAGAMAYDADKVAEKYWKPVLKEIAESVEMWKQPASGCTHEWIKTGLYNGDGSLSVPCRKCGAELRMHNGQQTIIIGGFKNPHGLKFHDPDGLEWLLMREVERDYRADELNLTKDSVVVDIGAHVGVVSISLAKTYGCKVYAYEPNGKNFERLINNTVGNGVDPLVQCWQFAVTGDGRKVQISDNPDNSGGGNIYGTEGDKVASVTLASILEEVGGEIDLLKIDCEGAEFEILADTESLKHVHAIRGEFHGANGDTKALLESVQAIVPDTRVTMLGGAA